MKKLLIAVFTVFSMFLVGCLKDTPNVDFSKVSGIVEFVYPGGANHNGLGAGMEFFGGGAFTFPPSDLADTVFFMANLAAPNPFSKDLGVTIGVDPNIITKYNADPNNAVKFVLMPDSCYTLLTKAGTIKGGKNLDTFYLVVYPYKIDPTQNFMAPVTILSASGEPISANFGTIFFHTIGNPIAGAYNWDYTRYNTPDGSGPPAGSSFTGAPTTFLPDDPSTIEVRSAYYIGPHYVLTFTNTGGVLSNFALAFNSNDLATMKAAGVTITDGPHIIKADPVTGEYIFHYVAFNGAAYRYIIDRYYK